MAKSIDFPPRKLIVLEKCPIQQKKSLISILNYMNRQPFRVLCKTSFCLDQTVESFLELVKNDDIKDSLISPRNVLCGRKNGFIGTTNIFTLRHLWFHLLRKPRPNRFSWTRGLVNWTQTFLTRSLLNLRIV